MLLSIIIFTLLAIVITGDRAPLILFCFMIFLFFLFVKKLRKFFFYKGFIASIIIVLIILLDPLIKERTINITFATIMGEYSEGKKVLISKAYEGHFNAAKIIFSKQPILGSGIKGFRNQCFNNLTKDVKIEQDKIVCSTHPHNYFLHILSETGLLGISIYFFLFLYCLKNLIKLYKLKKVRENNFINESKIIFLINFIIILWPLTTSGSFFNNYNTIFHIIPIILYLSILNKNLVK